jgi:hypothetical protein
MLIRVIDIAEYDGKKCNFSDYTPIITIRFTNKSELANSDIYDLVAKKFVKPFNLYSVDLGGAVSNNIELIPKSVGFGTYVVLSDKTFKTYEAIVVLGEFIERNKDTVTELFKKNGGGEVCDCELGGFSGGIKFDIAESLNEGGGGGGGGAAAAWGRGGSAKGGRKVRSRRRVIKKRRNITKKRIRRRNRK